MKNILPDLHNPTQLHIFLCLGAVVIAWISLIFFKSNRKAVAEGERTTSRTSSPDPLKRNGSIKSSDDQNIKADPRINKLDSYLQYLVTNSWHGQSRVGSLEFDNAEAAKIDDLSMFLGAVLKHVRGISPKLDIPLLIPRVRFETLVLCAGKFSVNSEGWITISVDNRYLLEPRASKAIMCHEICHYILGHNGILYQETIENEHLTEAAMFAFGLGQIFLEGYRFVSSDGYTHGVGYLEPAEYEHLGRRARYLWRTHFFGESEDENIERKYRTTITGPRIRERLLAAEMKKHPNRSRVENIKNILERYERDRR